MEITQTIPTAQAMEEFGGRIAPQLSAGLVVFLRGDLGAGKTTWVRGVLRAAGYHGAVKSPTYTLVEPYSLDIGMLYHFDFYRLNDPEELEFLGIRDYLQGQGICLIEWAERGYGLLPPADMELVIEQTDGGRLIHGISHSERGAAALAALT